MRNFILFIIVILLLTNCKNETLPLVPPEETPELVWESLNYPLVDKQIMAISINSNNDIFIGTNTGLISRFLSTDSTWNNVRNLFGRPISFIYIDSDDHLFVGTQIFGTFWTNTINYSEDNGENWNEISNKLRETYCFSTYKNNYYSAGYYGVSKSIDKGQNWVRIDSGIENKLVEGMAIDRSNGYIFIAIMGTGVLRSTDNGHTWSANYSFAFDPLFSTENGYVFASGKGLYRTIDHGESWHKLDKGIGDVFIQCFASSSKNYIIVSTYNNGLYLSKDYGDSWNYIGLKGTLILSVAFDKNDFAYVGTDSTGILKSAISFDY